MKVTAFGKSLACGKLARLFVCASNRCNIKADPSHHHLLCDLNKRRSLRIPAEKLA
jgi:hypothetical protein